MRCPVVAALLALAACDTGSGPAPPMGSRLRLLETIPGAAFRLSVDGRVVNANFHFGTLTPAIVVLPGQHTLSGQSLVVRLGVGSRGQRELHRLRDRHDRVVGRGYRVGRGVR